VYAVCTALRNYWLRIKLVLSIYFLFFRKKIFNQLSYFYVMYATIISFEMTEK